VDYSALSANFKQALAVEYQTHPALADIKDLNGFAKSYINAQQMIGADKVVLPRTDAPPEEWNQFYTKLGRPEAVDGYDFSKIELPKEFPRDEKGEKFVKELFHKTGLSTKQAENVYKEYATFQAGELQAFRDAQAAKVQEGLDSLQTEWGNKYEGEVALAKQAINAFGGEALKELMNSTGLGDHPVLIKVFNAIGKSLAEDKAFRDGSLNNGFAPTEDQAKAEIARLQTDPEFMKSYTNRNHATHAASKARMDNLWKTAYPGKVNEG
jgi:hypothetical protein